MRAQRLRAASMVMSAQRRLRGRPTPPPHPAPPPRPPRPARAQDEGRRLPAPTSATPCLASARRAGSTPPTWPRRPSPCPLPRTRMRTGFPARGSTRSRRAARGGCPSTVPDPRPGGGGSPDPRPRASLLTRPGFDDERVPGWREEGSPVPGWNERGILLLRLLSRLQIFLRLERPIGDGCVVHSYSREEILGCNCRFLNGPGTSLEVLKEINRHICCEQACTVHLLSYRKDRSAFPDLLHVSPIRNASGKVAFHVWVHLDESIKHDFNGLTPEVWQLGAVGAVRVAVRSLSASGSLLRPSQ